MSSFDQTLDWAHRFSSTRSRVSGVTRGFPDTNFTSLRDFETSGDSWIIIYIVGAIIIVLLIIWWLLAVFSKPSPSQESILDNMKNPNYSEPAGSGYEMNLDQPVSTNLVEPPSYQIDDSGQNGSPPEAPSLGQTELPDSNQIWSPPLAESPAQPATQSPEFAAMGPSLDSPAPPMGPSLELSTQPGPPEGTN
jgi:hypothetical protein